MGAKRFLLSSSITGVLFVAPALVRAEGRSPGESPVGSAAGQMFSPVASDALSLTPTPGSSSELNNPDAAGESPADTSAAPQAAPARKPVMMDVAPADEKPQIHGFFEAPFKTAYITPRGLVVEDKGLVVAARRGSGVRHVRQRHGADQQRRR